MQAVDRNWLRQRRNLLRTLVDHIPDYIYVRDLANRFVMANEAFARLMGVVGASALIGKRDTDFYPPEMAAMFDNIDQEVFAGRPFFNRERLIRFPNGQELTVLNSKVPFKNDRGEVIGLIGIGRDITERKQAETELRWKTAFLEALLASSIDGILVVNDQDRKVFQNKRVVELWKIPREVADDPDDARQVQYVMNRLKDPQQFVDEVKRLYGRPNEVSHDELEFTDGTILDRHSYPVVGQDGTRYGRIWQFRDITERKRVEAELDQERNLLRTLLDSSLDHIYFKDTQSRFVEASQSLARLFGVKSQDEMLGKTDFDFFTEAHARPAFEDEQEIIRTGQPIVGKEEREDWKDGHVTWVSTTKMPLRDAAGKVTGIMGISRDITERKQAETTRENERTLLRTLVDLIPDIIYVRDTNHRFLIANQATARSLGCASPDDLLGKTDVDFYPAETAAEFAANDRRVFAGERILEEEAAIDFPNGERLTILSTKVPLKNVHGEVVGLVGSIRDITGRKRGEEILRQFQFATDQAADTILWTNQDASFCYVNDEACRSLGYTREELMRLNLSDIDPAFSRQSWEENWRHGDQNPEAVRHFESVHRRKDGSTFPVEVMAKRFSFRGVVRSVAFVRNITERRRLESHLVQSQKMETVGKLAGGIAHEFNSILTAIIGQCALLLQDLPARSPLAKNADEISRAAERAAMLTRQLLAYGRKQFLQSQALNLNQVITGMSGVLSHLLGGEMVEVTIVPAAGLKAVKADAGQIEQVIINLAINAHDAMPQGGKFTLETANVTFDEEFASRYPELKAGKYVMLAVTDTGRGMSEEVKAHAFEPFFTTKGVGQGTGLGLSTCYGIIKQSGGHINVYCELGRGTTFKIYLPQMEPSLSKTSNGHSRTPDLPRGTETILLVEDDPALREMAAMLLKRLGYTVLTAANGIEALSLKQQPGVGHVDLLLSDVVMPHMGGKELSERVRVLFPHTRILFTSAYTENAIIHQGVLDKDVALLPKPFTPSALASKVREVLDQPGAPQPVLTAKSPDETAAGPQRLA